MDASEKREINRRATELRQVERRLAEVEGYRTFSCRACGRRFNERTGSPFNDLQFPTDVVLLAVLWRLRYKLGLRDVAACRCSRLCSLSATW